MMMWGRRIFFALIGLALLAVLGFNLFKTQIANRAFEQAVTNRAGVDQAAKLPDGLHLYLCGTGSPMPDPPRAGPCLGIVAGSRAYAKLRRYGLSPRPARKHLSHAFAF